MSVGAAVTAAIGSTVCCVLPFVLVSLGITGPWLARLQVFEPFRIPLDVTGGVAIAAAWASLLYSRRACRANGACALPAVQRRTTIALTVVTVIVVGLALAPYAIARLQ